MIFKTLGNLKQQKKIKTLYLTIRIKTSPIAFLKHWKL